MGLISVNELRKRVVFILDSINVVGVDFSYPINNYYPVKFLYPANLQEFIGDLILGLPYPVKFTYSDIFLYPVKVSMLKSAYFFEGMIIRYRNHHVIIIFNTY